MNIAELIKAMIFGIVEGVTEWLPISSTGHLIILDGIIKMDVAPELDARFAQEFFSMFEVVIQLGAILAVIFLFREKLCPSRVFSDREVRGRTFSLYVKVALSALPAAIVGLLGDRLLEKFSGKDIEGWLYCPSVVAAALAIYGVLFIVIECREHKKCRVHKGRAEISSLESISVRDALLVGCAQALSIIPGTSRSGSTILGARLCGIDRTVAAEFSFFMAIPAMLGASLIRILSFFDYVLIVKVQVPLGAWLCLGLASLTAFVVSLAAIRFLTDFLKKHTLIPFGIYRIILAALILLSLAF